MVSMIMTETIPIKNPTPKNESIRIPPKFGKKVIKMPGKLATKNWGKTRVSPWKTRDIREPLVEIKAEVRTYHG